MTDARRADIVGKLVDLTLIAFGTISLLVILLVVFAPVWEHPRQGGIVIVRAGLTGFRPLEGQR